MFMIYDFWEGHLISALLLCCYCWIYICLFVCKGFFFFFGYNLVMDFHVDDLCCCCCYCCEFE